MRAARWAALALGMAFGFLAACFAVPELTGPYQCDPGGVCSDPLLTCVQGLCCNPGGTPACPGDTTDGGTDAGTDGGTSGGTDGGPDGGADGGADAGPTCGAPCTVAGQLGPCSVGAVYCDGGAGPPTCAQVVSARAEICGNGVDENCDGVADRPYCDGPSNVLAPDGTFSFGAQLTDNPYFQTSTCVKDSAGNTPESFDGGRWIGLGTYNASTFPTTVAHVAWIEALDGGAWDLSKASLALTMRFAPASYLYDAGTQAFGYSQPYVMLCSDTGVRRLQPTATAGQQITASGTGNPVTLSMNTTALLDGTGSYQAFNYGAFSLTRVQRIEILITPARSMNDTCRPGFDVTFDRFGFIP